MPHQPHHGTKRLDRPQPARANHPTCSASSGSRSDKAAVVQLDDRPRVELLQPPRALLDRLGDRHVAERLAQHRVRPVRPPARLGDLGAVAQRPRRPGSSVSSRSDRSTKTNQRSGMPQVAICSCTRGMPRSSTCEPLRQSSTTVLASPARIGGTNASASTGGTPSRAVSAASATRTRRFHGQTSSVSSVSRTYASSGRSGSRRPARAERLQHGRTLPAGAFQRRDRAALLDVAAPVDLALPVESGQRFVHAQIRGEVGGHKRIVPRRARHRHRERIARMASGVHIATARPIARLGSAPRRSSH